MKKILNPYSTLDGYSCFGCSPKNSLGLQMNFIEEGDAVVCHWSPRDEFQGFPNTLHGGIQATLLDEIASWVIMVKLKTAGVTSRLDTRYLKPLKMTDTPITITARIEGQRLNQVIVDASITNVH
ncbi:MAG: thioesterase, partial [Bacteroidetes bacterium HGW-Bacteroidetes-22]